MSNKSAGLRVAFAGGISTALWVAIYATLNKVLPLDLSLLIVFGLYERSGLQGGTPQLREHSLILIIYFDYNVLRDVKLRQNL